MTAKMWDTTPVADVALPDVAAALQQAGVVVLVLNNDLQVIGAHGAVERCIGTTNLSFAACVLHHMPTAAHDAWRAAHAAVVRGAPHAALEVARRDHARVCHIAFTLSRLPTADPNERSIVCVGCDVTAQRVAEQREQQTMALAVHELRTPITALKGYAQLAGQRSAADDQSTQVRRMLQLINQQVDRLVQMLDKWADMVRIQQGKLRLLLGPVDLVALAEEVIRARQPDVSDRMLQVHSDASVTVVADRQRLRHALVLLLDTALKYSPANSPVHLRVNRMPAAAHVSVHDHGARIPAAQAQLVWEPWYQAPGETRRQFGGMGLQLYVVKYIVERHGGSVWVEPGNTCGNIWSFSLPLAC